MYITQIAKFLKIDFDYKKEDFLELLNLSNKYWFDAYKLEKDFLLTILLIYIWKKYNNLIFKWWTCLNKIYLNYYRLSEDLDFVVLFDWNRKNRNNVLEDFKVNLEKDFSKIELNILDKRTKFNEDKQWIFCFSYNSILNNNPQAIQIDISIKEKLETNFVNKEIKSLFIDRIFENDIFVGNSINCMSFEEIVAEKIRASLTRPIPAIRDFFDIWYIKNFTDFNFDNIKSLLHQKLKEVDFKYSLDWKFDFLNKQIKTDLSPVLNNQYDFRLDEIYNFILSYKI